MAEIIRTMPAGEYHLRSEVSNSFLTAWKENALHAIYNREHPPERTPALLMGEQVHLAVLEPQIFASRYHRCRKFDGRKTADKEEKAALIAEYGEDNLLSFERHDEVMNIVAAVNKHPRAKSLLEKASERETTILWTDAETGLSCKCRIDAMAGVIMADLKTTEDASVEVFQASIFKYGYHRQGAMYLRACRAAGIEIKHYSIIAVEKTAPFGCNVFSLDEAALHQGDLEISDLLKQVRLWQTTGIIPGYSDTVISASLPDWAWRKIEFEGAKEAA